MSGSPKAESSSLFSITTQKLWGFTWNTYFGIHFSWVYLRPQFWVQRQRIMSLGINSPCDWVEKSLYLATEGRFLCTTISYSTVTKFHGHILLWTGKDAFHKCAATNPIFFSKVCSLVWMPVPTGTKPEISHQGYALTLGAQTFSSVLRNHV